MKDCLIDFCWTEEKATGEDFFAIQDRLFAAWDRKDETDPLVVRFEIFRECWTNEYPNGVSHDATKDLMHCPH